MALTVECVSADRLHDSIVYSFHVLNGAEVIAKELFRIPVDYEKGEEIFLGQVDKAGRRILAMYQQTSQKGTPSFYDKAVGREYS